MYPGLLNLNPMKRSTDMKKAIIFTFALSLFALPMSLHANPPAKDDASKTEVVEPLSAMKSTLASPSESTEASSEVSETAAKDSEKAPGDEADAAKEMAEEAGKAEAKEADDPSK